LSDFPSLVPIGEALTDSGSASYLSNNSKKDQEEALKEKEQVIILRKKKNDIQIENKNKYREIEHFRRQIIWLH